MCVCHVVVVISGEWIFFRFFLLFFFHSISINSIDFILNFSFFFGPEKNSNDQNVFCWEIFIFIVHILVVCLHPSCVCVFFLFVDKYAVWTYGQFDNDDDDGRWKKTNKQTDWLTGWKWPKNQIDLHRSFFFCLFYFVWNLNKQNKNDKFQQKKILKKVNHDWWLLLLVCLFVCLIRNRMGKKKTLKILIHENSIHLCCWNTEEFLKKF